MEQKWSFIEYRSNRTKIYLSKSTLRIKIGRTVKKLETILVLEGKKRKKERKKERDKEKRKKKEKKKKEKRRSHFCQL